MIRATLQTAAVLICTISVNSAQAATDAEIDALYDALGIPELLQILRTEGLEQSEELGASMFASRNIGWDRAVGAIYDTEKMGTEFRAAFGVSLEDEDIAPLLEFFNGGLGEQIVTLELTAREALQDPGVEDAAAEAFETLRDRDLERFEAVERFVLSNDLIELNVIGGLNSSLAFTRGLADGGAIEADEGMMLSDVWAQEEGIREETIAWIYPYLAMAYDPLSLDEIAQYTDLMLSPAGKDLNGALVASFDALFDTISYDLGRAASQFMAGEDI